MFEAELQAKSDVTRSATFGTTTLRGLDPLPGTVFGEIKLSDQLARELAVVRSQVRALSQSLKEAQQSNASALSELDNYKARTLELESNLKMLQMQWNVAARKWEDREMELERARLAIRTLQDSYDQMEEAGKSLNSLLQSQYAEIDKLRIKETSQDYTTSLLQMENDIIGERLKGLYFSIEKAVQHKVLEEISRSEVALISKRMEEASSYLERLLKELLKVTEERDALVKDNIELTYMYNDMKAERDKIAKVAKEKVANLQQQLQKSQEEKDKLTNDLAKTEQNFKDLTDEYEKLRQKAKQYRQRRKMYGEEEEKICRNCQRVFIESENYNWSCRRHQSEFSGEVYWCCGKSGKDAIGCKTSKHESKEEDEEGEEVGKEAKDLSSVRCPVSSIQSCRKLGHPATQCPKDPNIRSTFDVGDEVQRIADVIDSRKNAEIQVSPETALDVLTQKSDLNQFHYAMAASSPTDEHSSDSHSDGGNGGHKPAFFSEIAEFKQGIAFDTERVTPTQNLVKFEEVVTKESEEMTKAAKRQMQREFSMNTKSFLPSALQRTSDPSAVTKKRIFLGDKS